MTTSQSSNSRLVAVLALGVLLNYVDRANLATAAPLLQTELSLSASQLGLLFRHSSGFMRPHKSLPAGWFIDTTCGG
jgi:ACS family D-galactonate transporter-like MFS transporter